MAQVSCQGRSNARRSSNDSLIKVGGCWLSDHSLDSIMDKIDMGKRMLIQMMSLFSFTTFQRGRMSSKGEGIACNSSLYKVHE